MIKNKCLKLIIALFIILLLGKYYFKFSPFITFDSTWYHSYVSIISGAVSLDNWDITRGFGFPIVIYLAETIFGKSTFGINMMFFIFYILSLYLAYLIIKKVIPYNLKPYKRILIFIFYTIILVFNPLIFGYSHVMLTESVIPFFALLAIYLSILISKLTYKDLKFWIFIFCYAITCIYTYFIKQPYCVIVLFPLIFTFIAELIRNFSWKKTFISLMIMCCIIVSILFSIKCWYGAINNKNSNDSSDKVNAFVNSGLISALQYHYQNSNICYDGINDNTIPQKFKKIIKKIYTEHPSNPCDYYMIYDVYDLFNIKKIDTVIFYASGDEYVLGDVLSFILKNFARHPLIVSDTYVAKYLTLIDFYQLDETYYVPIRHFGYNISENKTIGMAIYNDWKNYWWHDCTDEDIANLSLYNSAASDIYNMKTYESSNSSNNVPWLIKQNIPNYQRMFVYGFLITPFLFIGCFVLLIINRKKYTNDEANKVQLLFVIFGTIFMHLFAHTMVGAIIDRYAYVAYPLLLVGIIIIFISTTEKKKKIDFLSKNKRAKKLSIFILENEFNINEILNLPDNVLILTNCSVKTKKSNIKVVYYPKCATFNDKISFLLFYIKEKGYDMISLHINNCENDYYALVDDDICVVEHLENRTIKNLLYSIYIQLFTGISIKYPQKCTLIMNDKALFSLMNNNKFNNIAVLIKKVLKYDLKCKNFIK